MTNIFPMAPNAHTVAPPDAGTRAGARLPGSRNSLRQIFEEGVSTGTGAEVLVLRLALGLQVLLKQI